jgi:signal transduction histidine kinase/CheY-like chemotaxis protein
MKKFYIIFLALPILAFTLLYLSIWWFIGGVGALMIFIAYRFYVVRLDASEARNEVLEKELADLHIRLEHSVLKEQKTSKEAAQIKEQKQQLLSVISHEIRTPMNGIMGMALLMADTPLTKEQQECIDTIRSCGESLLTTVNNILANDILDFSKLQQEGNQLEYKDFDLRDSVEEVLELFAAKAGKTGLDLVYDMDEDVPAQIIGDSKRLRQVLINLIENAVKFTRQGEIFVAVHYTSHNTAGYPPELNFEVRDSGIGIAKDQLKQLFHGIPGHVTAAQSAAKGKPVIATQSAARGKQQDNEPPGLGLVICRKLVELMGGRIEVKSQQGQGSSFIFSIPITPSLKAIRNHAQHDNMVTLEGRNILIVDDNATSRNILMKQMKSWKMSPVMAESGKQALEILSGNTFDLVLTDINMPDMDGVQLAKNIRSQYAAIPIIALNFSGDEKYKQAPGIFSSVLTKPPRQYILRDHVLGALSKTETGKQNNTNPLSENFSQQYPLRILIAEDNLVNQKIATKILTKLGYQPDVANNGKEALEIVSNSNYDIILMDVQMPEMDGLEATRMIRTCLEIQPIIIAMTANVMQGDRDACMQSGMDDYMSKPIDLKELLTQLEKWALVLRDRRKIA